jgi:flagellar biosynthetic protein FlhB
MAGSSDRSEKPTSRRRRKAQEEGRVPRSRELSSATGFLAAILFFGYFSVEALDAMKDAIPTLWSRFLLGDITPTRLKEISLEVGWIFFKLTGPVVLLVAAASVAGVVGLGGFVMSTEPLKLKIEKLNPAQNVKKIFSKTGWVNLAKSLAFSVVIIYIFVQLIRERMPDLQVMVVMDLNTLMATAGDITYTALFRIAILLGVIAVGDILFQQYSFEEGLKMTKQEVRDDMKDTEGNPQIKGRIRRMQIQMARRRMMAAVKEADVVVTNPTHFAVALKFDLATMAAPLVVAKGQDYLALKIREIAQQSRVPLVENPELARALYKSAEVGEEVPVNLYRAVAQILAYVYKPKKKVYR